MSVGQDCMEICDLLSKSLTRGRLFEYGDLTRKRLDRLDDVLENCSAFLTALDAAEASGPTPYETVVGGYDAPNVIPFPWKARLQDSESV